ncbi:MAG: DNA primase [Alphaproteobacteria bacterium]|nr:DNA primase [Alphaproteobacteria bacterium]
MAGFNNNFTDELRQRLSIVDVVGRRVPLTKKGQNFWGRCPFHGEKTPSFSVNEQKGFYHCFGCGEHGDIISFVMKSNNMDFKSAIADLAQMAGLKLPDYKPKPPEQIAREKSYLEIQELAAKIYQEQLFGPAGAEALKYIRGRGFSDEVIKKYRLGYAPRNNIISTKFASQKEANLIAAGLVRRGDYGLYDFFRDKLMFPITNSRGEVIAFSGRSMDGSEPKYINTSDTELFHKRATVFGLFYARDAIHRANRSIVVEGQIDAIQMQTHGFPETVAPLGTALTEDHLQILCKHNRNITFCFDGDGAGQKAAARAAGLVMPLLRDNSDIRFAFVAGGKDPDDILRKTDGKKIMEDVIKSAVPLVDFLWQMANTNYLVKTPGGRTQAEKFLRAETEKISDPNLKNEFRQEYDQRKFNEWHKWTRLRQGSGGQESATMPKVDAIVQKQLSEISAAYPELIEKHSEFLIKLGINFDNATAGAVCPLSETDAEKFIVALKLKNYIGNLNADRATALKEMTPESMSRAKKLDSEIAATQEKLNKLSEA